MTPWRRCSPGQPARALAGPGGRYVGLRNAARSAASRASQGEAHEDVIQRGSQQPGRRRSILSAERTSRGSPDGLLQPLLPTACIAWVGRESDPERGLEIFDHREMAHVEGREDQALPPPLWPRSGNL